MEPATFRTFSGDAAGPPTATANINTVHQLVFDTAGVNLFIGDTNNDRIRKVAALGNTTPGNRLTITTTSLTVGTLNTVYPGAALAATGGTGALTWSLTGGGLSTGMGITLNSSSGAISRNPDRCRALSISRFKCRIPARHRRPRPRFSRF